VNPEIKERWVDALRSGQYEQGHSYLRNKADKLCCLGVLCELAAGDGIIDSWQLANETWSYGNRDGDNSNHRLPDAVMEWAGLRPNTSPEVYVPLPDRPGQRELLTILNDHGKPFTWIADVIEASL
jgi:hypothetical protein